MLDGGDGDGEADIEERGEEAEEGRLSDLSFAGDFVDVFDAGGAG